MTIDEYNQNLFRFIRNSPTQFHAVSHMAKSLEAEGFNSLREADEWCLKDNTGYFIQRNQSSLIAFFTGDNRPWETGMRLAGAHTDSPCLKIKPHPEVKSANMTGLGIEVYGGALLNTWFDRGLNLAGRVTCLAADENGREVLPSVLINYGRPVSVIPSLAIHLDRDANKNRSVNPQTDMLPLAYLEKDGNGATFHEMLFQKICADYPWLNILKVMDFDLSLSDADPPFFTGIKKEMISAPRLDNLLSCHAIIESMISKFGKKNLSGTGGGAANIKTRGGFSQPLGKNGCKTSTNITTRMPCLVVMTDHEEVGSDTASGARGSFLNGVLERIIPEPERRMRAMAKSIMISWDNAHAAHPAHLDRHEMNHLPRLNHGPVLKINAAQRYASDSESSAFFRYLCDRAGVPVQSFVMRSDMPCGSTIGPAISSKTGIKTVDAGPPTLAMHSIREITGNGDPFMVFQVLEQFFHLTFQPLLSLT